MNKSSTYKNMFTHDGIICKGILYIMVGKGEKKQELREKRPYLG